jgi:uncharacterized protein (DUF1330 family)
MSVYVVATYDIADPKAYEPYVPQVMPLLAKYGAEILVADFGARALEGTARRVTVVVRFESEEAAMAFYDAPEYAPVKQIRINSTANTNMVLAHEFVGEPA